MKKFLGQDRVLCISPHPDDAEYSMSGTILKYPDTQFDLLVLSEGGNFDKTTEHGHRLMEVYNFWESLDVSNADFLMSYTAFAHNGYITEISHDQWISWLEQDLSNQKYNCIMGPNELDTHFEHRYVAQFAPALARRKDYTVIQYKSPSTTREWVPNLYVELTEELLQEKIEALKNFESQLFHSYFNEESIRKFHENWEILKKGRQYAEEFKIKSFFSD